MIIFGFIFVINSISQCFWFITTCTERRAAIW
jgi:hypothetical protein